MLTEELRRDLGNKLVAWARQVEAAHGIAGPCRIVPLLLDLEDDGDRLALEELENAALGRDETPEEMLRQIVRDWARDLTEDTMSDPEAVCRANLHAERIRQLEAELVDAGIEVPGGLDQGEADLAEAEHALLKQLKRSCRKEILDYASALLGETEMCESGCGPATTHDCEGVPLCDACAAALAAEATAESDAATVPA